MLIHGLASALGAEDASGSGSGAVERSFSGAAGAAGADDGGTASFEDSPAEEACCVVAGAVADSVSLVRMASATGSKWAAIGSWTVTGSLGGNEWL